MRIFRICIIAAISLSSFKLAAQDVPEILSLEDAVALALEYNYEIKIARNNTEISNNDMSHGNAGYMPRVTLGGNYDYSRLNTDIAFASPEQPPIDVEGAVTNSYGGGINMNYNIYSGGQRKYTYRKLQNALERSTLSERNRIEETLLEVISSYLDAVNLYDAFQIALESVRISQERFNRAKENYAFGNFSKLELLNSEVDLSNDSTTMIQARIGYENVRRSLSNLIGIDPASDYDVSSEFVYDDMLQLDVLINEALSKNSALLLARKSLVDSELNEKLSNSSILPRVDFNGGYNYNRATYDANFIDASRNIGLNAGVSVSFDIFDGGNKRREQQNARILLDTQQQSLERTENNLRTLLLNTYDNYASGLELLELQERNLNLAQVNYERSQEAFGTGQITGIELREAQLNLINARFNVSSQRIETKRSEVSLYAYAGSLVD